MKQLRFLLICLSLLWPSVSFGFQISFGSSAKEIPKWVANPIGDDADFIYGVGEGDSLDNAVRTALSSISGKLATVVSSNISSTTTVDQGKARVYVSEDVRAKTFDTKLSNYELVQSVSQDDHFYAMVKMSRRAFVKDTMARLEMIDDRVNSRISLASKASKLQHYLALMEAKSDISDATALVLLLQAASPSFNANNYLNTYQKYQSTKNEILYKMKFRVEADRSMSSVAEVLIRLLGREKLSASSSGAGHADAVVSITGTAKNSIVFSEYATQLRINIQVTDDSGRQLNTEEHVVGGSSLTNFDASMRTATDLMEKELENEGALAILGLTPAQ